MLLALLAQKYVNKRVRIDAAQEYLGDMNNDAQATLTDISLILRPLNSFFMVKELVEGALAYISGIADYSDYQYLT